MRQRFPYSCDSGRHIFVLQRDDKWLTAFAPACYLTALVDTPLGDDVVRGRRRRFDHDRVTHSRGFLPLDAHVVAAEEP